MLMTDIFGTWGPSCNSEDVLTNMYKEGMTGIRVNLSHTMLADCREGFKIIKSSADLANVSTKILIDLQGPELRIGKLDADIPLKEGNLLTFGDNGVSIDKRIFDAIEVGDEILLDDGKIMVKAENVSSDRIEGRVIRGGILKSRKSILVIGKQIDMPTLTDADISNIKEAAKMSVTGVMLPFVRSSKDIITLRKALVDNDASHIKIYAKIENRSGIEMIDSLIPEADEIVIARGDLGNSMPLWELPGVQKRIAAKCAAKNKPFMVVTQMLSSMEKSAVPTRAEVSDIFNAILDGATSVMVTGETAVGDYPIEVIRYLYRTTVEAKEFLRKI